jgi:hypothetical protein
VRAEVIFMLNEASRHLGVCGSGGTVLHTLRSLYPLRQPSVFLRATAGLRPLIELFSDRLISIENTE